jgi:hypothetical protein
MPQAQRHALVMRKHLKHALEEPGPERGRATPGTAFHDVRHACTPLHRFGRTTRHEER